jgi:hypothetical protein
MGAAMSPLATIFDEFNLPNATTWFYFSLLLAVALFFKFSRLLSIRNWDIVTLFLLVPGLLLLQDAHKASNAGGEATPPEELPTSAEQLDSSPALARSVANLSRRSPANTSNRLRWIAYLWLMVGSAYFLGRCLMDLALVRRPALAPNLNLSGLAWLGLALFVCLVAVSSRRPLGPPGTVGRQSAAVSETQRRAENLVKQEIAPDGLAASNVAFWVESVSAMLCHLAIVLGLGWIGWRHFQDLHIGIAMATLYLLLPYTAFHVDQVHHVLPSALLVWAVAAYRRPTLAGLLIGLAAGMGYFPIFLFPGWLSFYWRRGAGRFAAFSGLAFGLCLAVIGLILWLDGDLAHNIQATLSLSEWQPWTTVPVVTEGFWTGLHGAQAYRLPVFIAYAVFVIGTLVWPWPKNLAHLIALSAAVVLGIQFWFADQGGVYVLWYLPLLILLVFRPNLTERTPPLIAAETDWLTRWRHRVCRFAARFWRLLPEPVARIS